MASRPASLPPTVIIPAAVLAAGAAFYVASTARRDPRAPAVDADAAAGKTGGLKYDAKEPTVPASTPYAPVDPERARGDKK
jgi:hypothetical protein